MCQCDILSVISSFNFVSVRSRASFYQGAQFVSSYTLSVQFRCAQRQISPKKDQNSIESLSKFGKFVPCFYIVCIYSNSRHTCMWLENHIGS